MTRDIACPTVPGALEDCALRVYHLFSSPAQCGGFRAHGEDHSCPGIECTRFTFGGSAPAWQVGSGFWQAQPPCCYLSIFYAPVCSAFRR